MAVLISALGLLRRYSSPGIKRQLIYTLLLVVSSSAVFGLIPLVLKGLIDHLEAEGGNVEQTRLMALVAAYALAHGLSRLLVELRAMCFGISEERLRRSLSEGLLRHLMSLPLTWHRMQRAGGLSQTLTQGLLAYRLLLSHAVLTLLPVSVELATMCVVFVSLGHAGFLPIICASFLLYASAFAVGTVRINQPSRSAAGAQVHAHEILIDAALNFETAKIFGGESQIQSRFREASRDSENAWIDLHKRRAEGGLAIAAVFALSFGLSVFIAAWKVRSGSMSIGEFALVNAYLLQLSRPVETLGFAIRDLAQSSAFLAKLVQLFSEPPERVGGGRRISIPHRPLEVAFEHVDCAYLPGDPILRDLNFSIEPGKTCAIVGATGCGKTSVIKLLLRLIEPLAGQIRVGGIPLEDIDIKDLRRCMAVVPQNIALFNESFAYNIAFGTDGVTREEVIRAASLAGIHDFISRLPSGYETSVGEGGLRLSGGERQRIAIARAAVRQPQILIFDEATSSLDPKTEETVLSGLSRLSRTATTFVIAHRLATVRLADTVLVLNRGRIVEQGSHRELIRVDGEYAAMWKAWTASSEPIPEKAVRAVQ